MPVMNGYEAARTIRQMDRAGSSLKAESLHVICTELAVVPEAEEDGADSLDRGCLRQKVVVSVQDDGSAVLHILDHLGLLTEDPFSCLEEFQVRDADVGDHAEIGLCHAA